MSCWWYLYNTNSDNPNIGQWKKGEWLPIDLVENVQNKLRFAFSNIRDWDKDIFLDTEHPNHYLSEIPCENCPCGDEIELICDTNNVVYYVVVASSFTNLVKICYALNLKYIFGAEAAFLYSINENGEVLDENGEVLDENGELVENWI